MNIKGKNLRVGDIIEVWWYPRKDKIIGLSKYKGRDPKLKGSQLAIFASMQIDMVMYKEQDYEVFNRDETVIKVGPIHKPITINGAEISIDIELLRTQKNYLAHLPNSNEIQGLINLLDGILDAIELGKVL